MKPRRRRAHLVSAALVPVAVFLTACGTADSTSAAKSTSTTSAASCTFRAANIGYGTARLGPSDPTTTVPTERGSRPISPSNDAGQQVIIAKQGYVLPVWLVAQVTLPIVWTNLSGSPQQVVFDTAPVRSPVIPPGGTFIWTSPGYGVNLTYHVVCGHDGQLTLQNANGQ